jgi:lipopolysaccharide transport system ATP-binding protein
LRSVDIDIFPGETLGVLGNNGAGKSTLLRLISGVILPDTGKVINRGYTVSLLVLHAGFDPNLSGYDNAVFAGMLQGYTRLEVKSVIDQIHEYSELGEFFFEPVRTYSTGMAARLGFSVANIISPDVLLIDEILAVGDQGFREKAERTMIDKIQSNQTIVLVSHSQHQISKLCDRVIIIEDGRCIASGNPDDILKIYNLKLHRSEQ